MEEGYPEEEEKEQQEEFLCLSDKLLEGDEVIDKADSEGPVESSSKESGGGGGGGGGGGRGELMEGEQSI